MHLQRPPALFLYLHAHATFCTRPFAASHSALACKTVPTSRARGCAGRTAGAVEASDRLPPAPAWLPLQGLQNWTRSALLIQSRLNLASKHRIFVAYLRSVIHASLSRRTIPGFRDSVHQVLKIARWALGRICAACILHGPAWEEGCRVDAAAASRIRTSCAHVRHLNQACTTAPLLSAMHEPPAFASQTRCHHVQTYCGLPGARRRGLLPGGSTAACCGVRHASVHFQRLGRL